MKAYRNVSLSLILYKTMMALCASEENAFSTNGKAENASN